MREGIGKQIQEEGDVYVYYEGNFKNDKKNGFGRWIKSTSSFYEGNFQDDEFEGEGRYVKRDFNEYKGTFKNSLPHGKGHQFNNKEQQ